MRLTKERKATWLLVMASFLWGSSFVGSKICLNAGLFPFETVFYRMAIGVTGLALVFRKELRNFSPAALRTGLILGAMTSANYTMEMYGITMTETTKASFLVSTNIVMMPFLCALFFRSMPKPRSFAAAAITITGVALMNLTGGESFSLALGDSLLLCVAFMAAMINITVAKLGGGASPIQITFIQLIVTTVYSGIMTLIQGRVGTYPPQAIGALLYLAIGPTFICFLVRNYSLQYLSPLRCSLILSTEGVFCALLSVIILHDKVTLKMVAGIILIFIGIMTENFGSYVFERLRGKSVLRKG